MSNYKIKLNNVRLSFPSIFNKSEFNGQVGKFEATFLMNKESQAKMITDVQAQIALIQKDNKAKVSPDKLCLKDGEFVDYDGYAGCMSIKAGSNRRPTIIDRDKAPIVEDDNIVYAGCYVNAVIELWYQDNSYGKRVNCNLLGIQFAKDGDTFGAGDTDVSDDFDTIDNDDF
jgi:hypothetical protein|tara:strand:+ start:1010 stop:1525 length:516 start_codon:yes stop_codon:yes gene_type:complete